MKKNPDSTAPGGCLNEEDEVLRLLEQAGPRNQVPAEDLRIIRAAARLEWENSHASAQHAGLVRLLKPAATAAVVLLVVALVVLWQTPETSPISDQVATVELLRGAVWLEEPPGPVTKGTSSLSLGGPLAAGIEIVTGQTDDRMPAALAIRLGDRQSVRFDANSRARLLSSSQLQLLEGAVYVDSEGSTDRTRVEIVTPFGSVTDIGTQFEVRLGEAASDLRVRVRTGSVSLSGNSGRHTAAPGEELNVGADGSVSRGAYDAAGSDWDWILSAAPALEIDGLPLSDFLEWTSRETGLAVEYEDQVLAEAVGAITLHGSIEGLRPDEAILAVLPGTGLNHTMDGTTLRIERRD